MITYSMSAEEIRNEVMGDNIWITGLANGIRIKYQREFSRYRPAGSTKVLEITKYRTPTRKNTVWIVWYKEVIGQYMTLSYNEFFERTDKYGKTEWIRAFQKTPVIEVFTHHSIDRLSERSGVSFREFLESSIRMDTLSYIEPYNYNGEKTYSLGFGDKGIFLCNVADGVVTCSTYVSSDMLGAEQVAAREISKKEGLKRQSAISKAHLRKYIDRRCNV